MSRVTELYYPDMPEGQRYCLTLRHAWATSTHKITIMRSGDSLIITRAAGGSYGVAYGATYRIRVDDEFTVEWSVESRSYAHTTATSGLVVSIRRVASDRGFTDPIMRQRLKHPRPVKKHHQAS